MIAPHPDDETLGTGGLIALAASSGRSLLVVVLTDGSASHPGSALAPPATLTRLRAQELDAALTALGHPLADVVRLDLADGALVQADFGEVVARLSGILQRRGVETIFVTGPGDTHPDHRRAFEMARSVAARLGAALWTYPVRAHVGGRVPKERAVRLSILDVLPLKRQALNCHATQMRGGIADAPEGFHLSEEDLAYHLRPYETFVPY